MEIKTLGNKRFGEKIDITDPCYSRDTWCRMNDVKIESGEYQCWVGILSDAETNGWGERVAQIGIRSLDVDADLRYRKIGNIGVDAALAGFFNEKPDYTEEQWDEICEMVLGNEGVRAWMTEDGFFSNSGYGDGSYDVYAAKVNRKIVALYIEFIGEDDD